MTTSAKRLTYEKLLLRYTGALERGDAETVAAVLRHAEDDSDLARMIDEINAVYAVEDSVIGQVVHQPSSNGHYAKESSMTMNALPAITRRAEKRRTLPLTLVATLAAFLILGSALFSAFNRHDQGTPAALQATATIVITASPTATATKQPMRYYMETLGHNYAFDSQHSAADYYQYIWHEAPNKYRVEVYGNSTVFAKQYNEQVANVAYSTVPDMNQLSLTVQKPFEIVQVAANNGAYAWKFTADSPAPVWQDPQVDPNSFINAKAPTIHTLDDLLANLRETFTDLQQQPDETILGRPVYVFEAKSNLMSFNFIARVVIKVDQATFVRLHLSAYDANNHLMSMEQAIKFMLDPTLDQNLFTFMPSDAAGAKIPDFQVNTQLSVWVDRTSQAEFDLYHLPENDAFTQKKLIPSEFYLDSFGRSSIQYYHTATDLFDTPALVIWIGNISATQLTNSLPGQMEPTQIDDFLRNTEVNGIKAWMGKVRHFPLIHKPYTAMMRDTTDFYRLYWRVADTVIVITADSSRLTEQDVMDVAGMLAYVPPMVSSNALRAAWQTVADQNYYGPTVFKFGLFDERVSDSIQTVGIYGGNYGTNSTLGYIFQSDPDSNRNARNAYYKLIPELPVSQWRDRLVMQRFRSSLHTGTELVITQGGSWIVPTEVAVASHEEEFDYYGFKGIYRVETVNTMTRGNPAPENIQTIITHIDGTTIVMQAPFDDQNLASLHKEEMLAILPTLKEVPPSTRK